MDGTFFSWSAMNGALGVYGIGFDGGLKEGCSQPRPVLLPLISGAYDTNICKFIAAFLFILAGLFSKGKQKERQIKRLQR